MPNQSNQTQPTSCPAPKEGSFRTTIGGQALIEGILMRGPEKQAIVVRNQNGGLEVQEQTRTFTKENYPILGIPFLRGIVSVVGSLVVRIKALSWSAEFYPEDEEESKSKFETWVETRFGEKALTNWITGVAMLAGLVFAVALFIVLPTLATSALLHFFPDAPMWVRNLLEGVVKLVIFFLYLYLCSKMKDIHRTFQYHGAEHKTIFCYERGLDLTVENARAMPRHHPRCGTSFLFVVVIVSIIVSSLVFPYINWQSIWVRVGVKLLLLVPVVGVTYEFNRLVGAHDNVVTRILSAPGMWLQNFTTHEPDDSMIEVAIEAMKLVIPEQQGKDNW